MKTPETSSSLENNQEPDKNELSRKAKVGIAIGAAAAIGTVAAIGTYLEKTGDEEYKYTSPNTIDKIIVIDGNEIVLKSFQTSLNEYHDKMDKAGGHIDSGEEGLKETMARAIEIAYKKGFPVYLQYDKYSDFTSGIEAMVRFNSVRGIPTDVTVGENIVPFSPDDYSSEELKQLDIQDKVLKAFPYK